MAVTYRSSTSATTGASAASSLVLTMPAGIQINDYLVASVGVDGGTAAAITTPSGWQLINTITDVTNTRLSVYGRIATGYEPASYNWNLDSARFASGSVVAYSGAHPVISSNNSSVTTASASTSVGGSTGLATYSGMFVKCLITRNTTSASSITTPSTSYTKLEDTCTTATTFIGSCIQQVVRNMPLGTVTGTASICSVASTAVEFVMMVEDARPAFNILAEDSYRAGSFTTARTSTSIGNIQVNVPNTLLLAFMSIPDDAATISSLTATGLTWELVARSNAVTGSCEIWRAMSPTTFLGRTVTINFSGSVVSANFVFMSMLGADMTGVNGSGAIGTTNTASTSAAAPSINLTTTRDNSWVWAMASESSVGIGTITPGSNQFVVRALTDATNVAGSWTWRQTAITPTAGTNVTMNTTNPTTANCNVVAVEILPAIHKNLGAMGVG
jgi:hypothetical protein